MRRLLRTCTIALAAALPVSTVAAPPQMPVSVTADSGRFEQDAGSGLYRGNVELIQGKRKLFADEMRLFTRNGELIRVEASGTPVRMEDRKSTRLNSSHDQISYAVFCLKKKIKTKIKIKREHNIDL